MIAILGLGNPGAEYENTRHNIGFIVLDELASQLGVSYESDKYMLCEVAKSSNVWLVKPETYVNKSGECAKAVIDRGIDLSNIWVVHDDVEIPFGEVRIKKSGSSGGHNGLKSIDEQVGEDYFRIRVGVGRDQSFSELSNYVLSPFTQSEQTDLPRIIDQVVSHLIQSIDEQEIKPISFVSE